MSLGISEWLGRRKALKELKSLDLYAYRRDVYQIDPLVTTKTFLKAGDDGEALRQWQAAKTQYPMLVHKSHDSIGILLDLKRFDEAESLIKSQLKQRPRDHFYVESFAYVSERRGDMAEAVARWQDARKRFPGAWRSYVRETVCLCTLRDWIKAEILIEQAMQRFPEKLECRIEWGRIAERKEDWQLAAQRWDWVRQNFDWAGAPLGLARALEHLGRSDEAFEMLLNEQPKYRKDADLAAEITQHRRRVKSDLKS